jgi:hypothetical protein
MRLVSALPSLAHAWVVRSRNKLKLSNKVFVSGANLNQSISCLSMYMSNILSGEALLR